MNIYHIVLPNAWAMFEGDNYRADSLETEGFIHCSYREQLDAVLNRYYEGAEKVIILEIGPELLTSRLVAEPSTGGEIYPHIYGPINKLAIVGVEERNLAAD